LKLLSIFFCRGAQEISCKKYKKAIKECSNEFLYCASLSAAKQRLLDDVEALKEVKLLHIPRRWDGDGRISLEVDDLIAVFNLLDDKKSIEL